MKHIAFVSQKRHCPASATSLLVKERQIALLGEAVDLLGSMLLLVEDVFGKEETS